MAGTHSHGSRRIERMRRRQRLRRVAKWSLYAVCAVVLVVLAVPPVVDRAVGATRSAGECTLVRVLDADRFRLDCDVLGRLTAHLQGADAPATRDVACWAEFRAGWRAKWLVRRQIWAADEVWTQLDGLGFRARTLVVLRADDAGVAGALLEAGLARPDDGYSRRGWCGGQLAALDAEDGDD